mmetsp:Transcript_5797/g.14477  ORF Transcript_5797/g.14477 Transcript_5797/m.14477 type:complete len:82 (-) Transcript_5797:1832-2077(-)
MTVDSMSYPEMKDAYQNIVKSAGGKTANITYSLFHFFAFRAFRISLNRTTHSFFDFPVTPLAMLLQRSFFSMLGGYVDNPF